MCKTRLHAYISTPQQRLEKDIHYHPRNCMKAKQPHIDLPCIEPLCSLAMKQGIKLLCRSHDSCIKLLEPLTGIEVEICIDTGKPRCQRQVYIMKTRSGNIYIGPVIITTESIMSKKIMYFYLNYLNNAESN